jgi:hypothetical protein
VSIVPCPTCFQLIGGRASREENHSVESTVESRPSKNERWGTRLPWGEGTCPKMRVMMAPAMSLAGLRIAETEQPEPL